MNPYELPSNVESASKPASTDAADPTAAAAKAQNQSATKPGKTSKPTSPSRVPLINPAWIEAQLSEVGLPPGRLADAAGVKLAELIEPKAAKLTTKPKITKLLRAAIAASIGKNLPE